MRFNRNLLHTFYRFRSSLCWLAIMGGLLFFPSSIFADVKNYIHDKPYEAPPYVPPPPPQSKVRLTNHQDGTLTDQQGLMWTQKDSYADLGQCLNWYQSYDYVKSLKTGGHADWRMPTSWEMYGIYDDTIENVTAWDHDPENPLHLDTLFADGAAYWYWSGDKQDTDLTDCCAPSFYFVTGLSIMRRLSMCNNGGVRAVRNAR
jgi:Protein of unknown function (DUF1566)